MSLAINLVLLIQFCFKAPKKYLNSRVLKRIPDLELQKATVVAGHTLALACFSGSLRHWALVVLKEFPTKPLKVKPAASQVVHDIYTVYIRYYI